MYIINTKPLTFPTQGFLWETSKVIFFFPQPFDLTEREKKRILICIASIQNMRVPINLAKVLCWTKLRIFNTNSQ